jgi:predicted permease
MDPLFQDIRYALRILRMTPGFTSVSVLTLALGIVGTTLVFTAYSAVMLQPLPAREPERLTVLYRHFRKGGESSQFTIGDYRRIGEHNGVFPAVAAEGQYDTVLAQFPDLQSGRFDEPRQALVKLVSDNYFTVLGVGANPGRVFSPADLMSHGPVAVLSYSSWHRRFRNNYSVLGQTILIYGAAVTIVGITPPDFVGSGNPPVPPDVWLPLWAEPMIEPQRSVRSETDLWLRIVGRLKPGITVAQAENQLTALEQQDEKARGVEQVTAWVGTGPAFYFIEPGNPQFRILAAMLLVSFSIVLLVACANMANFFMARATARRREMAVRGALGASRGRLLRQLITEGVLLGLAGGAVAVVASKWICDLVWWEVEQHIIARFTDLYVFTFRFTVSPRVLAATCLVSVLAGTLFSLIGAVQSSRVDLNQVLKGGELRVGPGRRFRLSMRDFLIAAQVMLSVVLLVSAAVLARGMIRGQSSEPGFNVHNILDMEFAGLDSAGYDSARMASLREQLHARMAFVPGVSGVAFSSHVPLLGYGQADISKPGSVTHEAFDNDVSPGFFATLGIPLVGGRDFSPSDIAQRSAVVIVSQATAHNLWPDEDPIGKRLQVGSERRVMQVIGVAQDVRSVNVGLIEPYLLYLPLAPDAPLDDVLLRATGDANQAIPQTLKTASAIDPKLASLGIAHSLDDALWAQRLPSTIATLFATIVGSLALVLASVGIYGTIAYAVAQRTREIGIRIALGAQRLAIVRLVLSRAMALAGVGACVGLVGAAALSRAVSAIPFGIQSSLLFGMSPRDPVSFAGVAIFLASVALAAAYRPAMKATKVAPMVALRCE